MQGRVVILRCVLRAMPVYHLMSLCMLKDGFKRLEDLYREFLWGLGDNGDPKVPLVAWSTITKSTKDGGLNFQPFEYQAQLLKMRCTAHIVENFPTEWVKIANVIIKGNLRKGPHKRERRA